MSTSNRFNILRGQDGDVHERVGMEIPPGFEILGADVPAPATVVTTTIRAVAPVTVEVVIKPEPATAIQRARQGRPTFERRFGTKKNREPTASLESGSERGRTATRTPLRVDPRAIAVEGGARDSTSSEGEVRQFVGRGALENFLDSSSTASSGDVEELLGNLSQSEGEEEPPQKVQRLNLKEVERTGKGGSFANLPGPSWSGKEPRPDRVGAPKPAGERVRYLAVGRPLTGGPEPEDEHTFRRDGVKYTVPVSQVEFDTSGSLWAPANEVTISTSQGSGSETDGDAISLFCGEEPVSFGSVPSFPSSTPATERTSEATQKRKRLPLLELENSLALVNRGDEGLPQLALNRSSAPPRVEGAGKNHLS
jgi:hypothetical protein